MPYSRPIPLRWLRDNLWAPLASEPNKREEIIERVKCNLSTYGDDGVIVCLI